jgi:flagellar basal-body rod protein FlgB
MGIVDSVEQLRSGLDYLSARHDLLTANLAHADTPGYRPLDLQRTGFSEALHTAMATTQPDHILSSNGSADGAPWRVVEDSTAEARGNDGNAVSIDREAVKIASNQLRYDALATLVQGQLAGLEWAAGDGK